MFMKIQPEFSDTSRGGRVSKMIEEVETLEKQLDVELKNDS